LCTLDNISYQDLNPDCGDQILERAFSSEFNDIALSFDHTSSSIGNFDVTQAVYEFNESVPEPHLYFVSWCDVKDFSIRGSDVTLSKDQLSMIIIVSDILIVIAFVLGYNSI